MGNEPRTIFVINRLGTLRRITLQALKNLGHRNVVSVAELDEAAEWLEDLDDVIIILELSLSDWRKVELEFINYLKKYRKLKNIAVIVTAQVVDNELLEELKSLKVKELIIRPIEIAVFAKRISEAIERIARTPKLWATLRSE